MNRLKEIAYVLWHARSLADRYKKKSFGAVFFLALSVLTRLAKNNFFTSPGTTQEILHWTSLGSLLITGFLFLLAFLDLIRTRFPLNELICTSVTADAYYHAPAENAYELVERIHCHNRTDQPMVNFADIQDGYTERLTAWSVEHALRSEPKIELRTGKLGDPDARPSNIPGMEGLYVYAVKAWFDPSLASRQEVDLAYRISAKAAPATPVEAAAFTVKGSSFARGVDYDTLLYYVTIHAPQGYEIYLLDWGIIDAVSREMEGEKKLQNKPRVNAAKTLLTWKVSLARKHLRYMLKYKFEAYDWTPAPH